MRPCRTRRRAAQRLTHCLRRLNAEADAIVTAREEDVRRKQASFFFFFFFLFFWVALTEAVGQTHIRLLHEYNETRDAAQVLFGQLATLDGLTIQDVYGANRVCALISLTPVSKTERFGVSLDD